MTPLDNYSRRIPVSLLLAPTGSLSDVDLGLILEYDEHRPKADRVELTEAGKRR